ncbi:MAG: MFS transporter, partial [Deltaproteobacteria bacterium]|nr:MFS transporter [Deltaproteobacteria bacterium]
MEATAPKLFLRLPAKFWVLLTGAFINRLGTFVGPFLSVWLTGQRHMSVETVGLITSMMGLGALFAAPMGGFLADKFGRRGVILLGTVGGGLSLLHVGYAQSAPHLMVAVFIWCFLNEQYRPAMLACVADLVGPEERMRAFGLTYWAANLGFSVALPLGGVIAARGYGVLFVADALTSFIFGCVIFFLVGETKPARRPDAVERHPLAPFADLPFVVFCLLTVLTSLIFQQTLVTVPLAMTGAGLSTAMFGTLIALNGVLIVVLQPFAERVTKRFPRPQVLAVSSLMTGVGMAATGLAHEPIGYLATIMVWTLGEIGMAGLGPSVVADRAPAELQVSSQGTYQMS